MTIGPGARVGPYEVTALIGEGGMGKVWRAHHLALKRDDALKVLPDAFLSRPGAARALPARSAGACLAQPSQHRPPSMVSRKSMACRRWCWSSSMDRHSAIASRTDRFPSTNHSLIAAQIVEALEAAQEHGIIHRDLKPANIKVRPDGNGEGVDFGLAKAIHPPKQARAIKSNSPTISLRWPRRRPAVISGRLPTWPQSRRRANP